MPNETGIIINGTQYSQTTAIVALVGLLLVGLALGLLYNYLKNRKKKPKEEAPKELPTPEYAKAKMTVPEKLQTLNLPDQNIELGYDQQLEADIHKLKNEMKDIEGKVNNMKTNYRNLKTKLDKLEKVKGMLNG